MIESSKAFEPVIPQIVLDPAQLSEAEQSNQSYDRDIVVATNELNEIKNNPNRAAKWAKRTLIGMALGSAALTIASDNVGEAKDAVVEAAPWVAGGVGISETLFIGGAALMVGSVGEKIGNPLKVKERLPEIIVKAGDSNVFRAGMAMNTVGAFGDAVVIAAGTFKEMPIEAWGIAGIAAVDGVGTLAVRKWMIDKYRQHKSDTETETSIPGVTSSNEAVEKREKIKVRHAAIDDIDRLADIDLARFRKAYGEQIPDKADIVATFTERLANADRWMFVAEVDGQVEGFVSAFPTDKSMDDFISWEESTADGTLKDKIVPKGKNVYVVNMTVNPAAMKLGGEDMLLANLFANGIENGVETGYFVSRMPFFKKWIERRVKNGQISEFEVTDPTKLEQLANEYVNLKRVTPKGEVRHDYELRLYEENGFKIGRVVANGFQDEASMDFGVLCSVDVPPTNTFLKKVKPFRLVMASALRQVAKKPKLLQKVL